MATSKGCAQSLRVGADHLESSVDAPLGPGLRSMVVQWCGGVWESVSARGRDMEASPLACGSAARPAGVAPTVSVSALRLSGDSSRGEVAVQRTGVSSTSLRSTAKAEAEADPTSRAIYDVWAGLARHHLASVRVPAFEAQPAQPAQRAFDSAPTMTDNTYGAHSPPK